MGFSDPRIPARYSAIDSDAFASSGGPALDAMITDAIAQAANRLKASAAHMFALAVPTPAITYGDTTSESYAQPLGPTWAALLPAVTHAKKPGHTAGDYRVIVKLASARTALLQVATRAEPYRASADTTRANIVEVTGTGSWQTVEINSVPLHPGELETCSVFARSDDASTAHTAGTYGTPVTGTGVGQQFGALSLTGATSSYATTREDAPNDYGSRGYLVQITDTAGVEVAMLRITRVSQGNSVASASVLVDIAGGVPSTLSQFLARSGVNATWRLYEPSRIAVASVSGAVAARSV